MKAHFVKGGLYDTLKYVTNSVKITSVIKFIFAMIESIPNVVRLMLLCKQYFLLHSENCVAKMILQ